MLFVEVTRKVLGFGDGNNTGIYVTSQIAIVCSWGKDSGKKLRAVYVFYI